MCKYIQSTLGGKLSVSLDDVAVLEALVLLF